MKTIRLIIAIAVFVIAPFCAPPLSMAAGAEPKTVIPPPCSLPDSLPIGSDLRMLDWIVTNRTLSSCCQIQYTNFSNPTGWSSRGIMEARQWSSYAAFNQHVIDSGFAFFNETKSNMVPNTTVRFQVIAAYYYVGPYFLLDRVMLTDTNLGTPSAITYDSFANSTRPTNKCVVVSVPGLQFYSIQSANGYSNTWPANQALTSASAPSYPPELTTNDTVVINGVFGQGTNWVRIKLAVDGVTNTYTQFGDLIKPYPLSMPDRGHLEISTPRGADIQIISSANPSDFSHPLIVTNIAGLSGTNRFIIPIDAFSTQKFYRAIFK